MPITQDRMLALVRIAKELVIESETIRQTVERYAASEKNNDALQALVLDLKLIPRPDKTIVGIEEYHFRKFYSRNKSDSRRMAARRRSLGVESIPIKQIPLLDPIAARPSKERLAELAAIERDAEQAALLNSADMNETEEEMLVRFQQEGMTEKQAKSSIQALKDEGAL